jgi:hypothetical protein
MEKKEKSNYQSIPPGTVDIKAEVLEVFEEESLCRLQIIEILEYGPSVSQVASGKEMDVFVPGSLSKEEKEKLKSGKIISGRILQTKSPDREYWEIIIIK